MRVGIFGGTFDPIHQGHLYIASEAFNKLNLDKLIFMPSGNPPHKRNKSITEANIRLEMVNIAIRGFKNFEVSDYEIKKQGLSYTYETLEHYKTLEEATELFFITGADCLIELHTWKSIDRIFKACNFVVFNRPGYTKEEILKEKAVVENKYNTNIIYLDLLQLEISSSYIREAIGAEERVDFFLHSGVYSTIKALGLYRRERV